MEQVKPLLLKWGMEMPSWSEEKGTDEWALRIGDFRERIAKVKNGRPRGAGMDHPGNVAGATMTAVTRGLTRWLISKGSPLRASQISDMNLQAKESPDDIVLGVALLTDEQSYELMWTGLGGCYCRVMRTDVF
jgi:hypothetical protein